MELVPLLTGFAAAISIEALRLVKRRVWPEAYLADLMNDVQRTYAALAKKVGRQPSGTISLELKDGKLEIKQ